jgi:hypothetical protein
MQFSVVIYQRLFALAVIPEVVIGDPGVCSWLSFMGNQKTKSQ